MSAVLEHDHIMISTWRRCPSVVNTYVQLFSLPDLWHSDGSGNSDSKQPGPGQQLQEELCHLQPNRWPGTEWRRAVGCAHGSGHPQVWQVQHEHQRCVPSQRPGGHRKHGNRILETLILDLISTVEVLYSGTVHFEVNDNVSMLNILTVMMLTCWYSMHNVYHVRHLSLAC